MILLLQVQNPKIAFTANAFVRALQTYGEDVFKLVPFFGKIRINEKALCCHPQIMKTSLTEEWMQSLLHHWFDIVDYFPEAITEMDGLKKLNSFDVDNVIVFVDTLYEYSTLNRTYATDELYTVDQLPLLLYSHQN